MAAPAEARIHAEHARKSISPKTPTTANSSIRCNGRKAVRKLDNASDLQPLMFSSTYARFKRCRTCPVIVDDRFLGLERDVARLSRASPHGLR